MNIYKNSKTQSIYKTITWRIIAALVTGTTVFIFTGEIKETTKVVVVIEITLTVIYYFHERIWARFSKNKISPTSKI